METSVFNSAYQYLDSYTNNILLEGGNLSTFSVLDIGCGVSEETYIDPKTKMMLKGTIGSSFYHNFPIILKKIPILSNWVGIDKNIDKNLPNYAKNFISFFIPNYLNSDQIKRTTLNNIENNVMYLMCDIKNMIEHDFIKEDIKNLNLKNKQFDFIIISLVFHLSEFKNIRMDLLNHFHSLLKPNGIIYMRDYKKKLENNQERHTPYTFCELYKIKREYNNIEIHEDCVERIIIIKKVFKPL